MSPSEMRLLNILISDVKLKVRVGSQFGEDMKTNVGVVQGDCLSAVLFIFYLAKSVKPLPPVTAREDHEGEALWSALDWLVKKDVHNIEIDPKYSDDMSFIRSTLSKLNMVKRIIPGNLAASDLLENSSKREEYEVSRESNEAWKKCKYLGSLLDTEKDIERRKILALDAMKTLEPIYRSRKVSDSTKLRIFEAYVSSILLYNSELWTLTNTVEKQIDSFQRRLLRRVLQIFWPKIITNERLYQKTKVIPWSNVVRKRRLTWVGHLLRLDERTPARQALNKYFVEVVRPVGRPKLTWVRSVFNDVKTYSDLEINFGSEFLMFRDLVTICADRIKWRKIVKHIVLQSAT